MSLPPPGRTGRRILLAILRPNRAGHRPAKARSSSGQGDKSSGHFGRSSGFGKLCPASRRSNHPLRATIVQGSRPLSDSARAVIGHPKRRTAPTPWLRHRERRRNQPSVKPARYPGYAQALSRRIRKAYPGMPGMPTPSARDQAPRHPPLGSASGPSAARTFGRARDEIVSRNGSSPIFLPGGERSGENRPKPCKDRRSVPSRGT